MPKCEYCEETIKHEVTLLDIGDKVLEFCSSECEDDYIKENTRIESVWGI